MELYIAILTGTLSGIITLVVLPMAVWIFNKQVKRIDDCETTAKDIKDNYIERFDRVDDKLEGIHNTVIQLYTEHQMIMKEKGNCR